MNKNTASSGISLSVNRLKDNKQHKLPHIHAKYQDHEIVISIPNGDILDGQLPPTKTKLLLTWVAQHQQALIKNWELAISGQQPHKINPLR